jgi:3-dehydroshikimate dehydratase
VPAAFVLSAFADEISPELSTQLDVLAACGLRYLELRSVWNTNVLDLTPTQRQELQRQLTDRGFRLSAIGSPIGKVKISDPWPVQLDRFKVALERALEFSTPRLRLFSFYPADPARSWDEHRAEVLRRLHQFAELADQARVTLLHENEHRIYGEDPVRVRDLLQAIDHPRLRAVYDPGNYVHGGFDPWQAWELTRPWTVHLHIKDWVTGHPYGWLAGAGQGRIAEVLADAAARGYHGFATLEPHLRGGGPTGGVTGPDLFPAAVAALRRLLPPGTEATELPA